MLDLYHAEPMANSLKTLLAIHEKGVPFGSHLVNLHNFEQHEPWYVRINPNGQVPALVHDGKVITESTVINEYLDEAFEGPPLRPADPYGRARMRIWTKFVDEYFCPALSFIGWHHMIRNITDKLTPEEFERKLAAGAAGQVAHLGAAGLHEGAARRVGPPGARFRGAHGEAAERNVLAGRRRVLTGRRERVRDGGAHAAAHAQHHESHRDTADHGLARTHECAARHAGRARHAQPRARDHRSRRTQHAHLRRPLPPQGTKCERGVTTQAAAGLPCLRRSPGRSR
jgi:glutathione S-transferase